MRLIQLLLGLVLALPTGLALSPMVAAFRASPEAVADGARGAFGTFWLLVLVLTLIAGFAASLWATLGRGVLMLGLAILAAPLSLGLATGRVALDSGGVVPGLVTAIFGGLFSLLAGLPGVIFGAMIAIAGAFLLFTAPRRG